MEQKSDHSEKSSAPYSPSIEKNHPVSVDMREMSTDGLKVIAEEKVLPISLGQKMYLDRRFDSFKDAIEATLNRSLDDLRGRVQATLNRMNTEQLKFTDDVQKHLLTQLKRTDQKFSGLYRTLIHEFLTKLEQRTLNTEMYTTAIFKKCAQDFSDVVVKIDHMQDVMKSKLGEPFDESVVTPLKEKASVMEKAWLESYDRMVNDEAAAFAKKAQEAHLANKEEQKAKEASDVAVQKETPKETGPQNSNG